METVSFNIPSISCSACSRKIQEEIKSLQGIENVSVDLKTQSVNVDYDPGSINSQEIKNKIISMGYEVTQ